MSTGTLLLVGLGNPGAKYARNRHNIGFMAVDAIARRWKAGPWKEKHGGELAIAVIEGRRVMLLKPLTYMNESGRSAGAALNFLKLPIGNLVALHDELDLAPAKLRVKTGGGNAGHNGLRSITALCGNNYRRVRIGIGHPGDKDLVHSYVLNDFAKAEETWVEAMVSAIAELAPLLAKNDDERFQNDVALRMQAQGFDDVKRVGEGR
jgi:peptidyl-tRNA hydrolase, PTH1 family